MQGYQEEVYTKKIDVSLWKKMFSKAMVHKKYIFTIIFLNIFIALLDTFFPIVNMYAIEHFVERKDLSTMTPFLFVYGGLFILQALLIYFFLYAAGKIEMNVVHDIRRDGFEKLQNLSFSYFDTTPVGWIVSRMTSDAQRVGDVLAWSILDIFWSGFIIIFCVFNMFVLNPTLAVYITAAFPLLIVISYIFQTKILKGHRAVRRINSQIVGVFNESINGAKTTKTLVREEKNYEEFSALSNQMKENSIRVMLLSSIYIPIVSSIGSISLAFVIGVGGVEILNQTISIAVLSVFISYVTQIFEPIKNVARIFSEMQSAQASAERVFSLLETPAQIADAPEVVAQYGDLFYPKKENWASMEGAICFDHVSFSYLSGEKVLEDFCLTVRPGERIALVGETGSGKSTIVNLICRFYEPTNGTIYIDGVDYKKRSQLWLHSHLGYVLQSPHLFSGTVMNNIKYGKLEATDEEAMQAAKLVNAYDFIQKLEHGFQTEVGEGGNRLSAGERQLISFARAIVSNPHLFILDEATSSIDTETERIIQRAIEKVLQGRTSFIIAHRLSTVRFCDRILVIENGKIIEDGNHKTLIQQKGHYYKLYTNQFKEEEKEKLLV